MRRAQRGFYRSYSKKTFQSNVRADRRFVRCGILTRRLSFLGISSGGALSRAAALLLVGVLLVVGNAYPLEWQRRPNIDLPWESDTAHCAPIVWVNVHCDLDTLRSGRISVSLGFFGVEFLGSSKARCSLDLFLGCALVGGRGG
jgi:hypothetical protein